MWHCSITEHSQRYLVGSCRANSGHATGDSDITWVSRSCNVCVITNHSTCVKDVGIRGTAMCVWSLECRSAVCVCLCVCVSVSVCVCVCYFFIFVYFLFLFHWSFYQLILYFLLFKLLALSRGEIFSSSILILFINHSYFWFFKKFNVVHVVPIFNTSLISLYILYVFPLLKSSYIIHIWYLYISYIFYHYENHHHLLHHNVFFFLWLKHEVVVILIPIYYV